MGTGDMCRVPPAAVRHGRVRQSSGTGSCGDCKGVVGIVVPFAPRGLFGENSFYRAPGDKWVQETCVGCPQQRHATEESGKVHGRDRVGIVEGSYVYLARGVSIRGKFVLSRNPEYKTRGRHVAKRSSDPRVAYPEVKVQVQDELWVLLPPLSHGESIFGENSFYRAPGGKWAQETCAGAPSSGTPRESQAKFRDETCGDCRRVLQVLGPRGQYSGKIRFIEKLWVQG